MVVSELTFTAGADEDAYSTDCELDAVALMDMTVQDRIGRRRWRHSPVEAYRECIKPRLVPIHAPDAT
jgi:hypothetical protein